MAAKSPWTIATSLSVIFLLSNLPTPLYVVYQEQFGFSQITLTLVYSAYVAGTLLTMFFLGRLSDQIGRRPVMLASLGLAAASAVLFLLARSTPWLYAARIVSGIAIALASGASTAWVVELEPHGDQGRGTRIAIGANDIGLALGPLLAGVLADFAPAPLRLSYWLFLAVLIPAAFLALRTKETGAGKPIEEASFEPQLGVKKEKRGGFVAPAVGAFAAFAVLGFYSALIPTLLGKELHLKSHTLAGGIVALLFGCGTVAIAWKPSLPDPRGLRGSLVALLPGTVLLVVAEALRSLPCLIAATIIGGFATGLAYRSSLRAVNALVPDEERSGMVSAYLIVCYAGISLPVIGIGLLGTALSPLATNAIFAGVVCVAAIVALVVSKTKTRTNTKPTPSPKTRTSATTA
ncbi:MAG TPA: MFS transporter [Myxococcales bacterium]|jgi:MFS family permease